MKLLKPQAHYQRASRRPARSANAATMRIERTDGANRALESPGVQGRDIHSGGSAERVGYDTSPDEATVYATARRTDGVVGLIAAVSGPMAGEVYALRSGCNLIGRSRSCDVHLPLDLSVSRQHAEMHCEDGVFLVKPLKPGNPTLVSETPVEGCEEMGDLALLRVGRSTFRLLAIERC